MKILIIRYGAIGDVVHTTNCYRAIKQKYPNTEIHYLTSDLIKPLLENDPDITKVWTLNSVKIALFSKSLNIFAEQLKKEKFDLVINLQPSLKMRYLVFKSGIKKQLIYKKNFKLHAVKNFWAVAKKEFKDIEEINNLKLYISNDIKNTAKNYLKEYKRPFIVFNTGGIFSKRQGRTYPVEKWIELGNLIQKEYDGTIILTGSNEDSDFLRPLEVIENSVSFIGKLSLPMSCGIIGECDLMISGDSGPIHIASALGVKSIGLYGSMPVNRTGVYGENGISITSNFECVPCNKRKCKYIKHTKKVYTPCMEAIQSKTIIENIHKFLEK